MSSSIIERDFDSADSLWAYLMDPLRYPERNQWAFRGQADASWKLTPRAHRPQELERFLSRKELEESSETWLREHMLLGKFAGAADDAGLANAVELEWLDTVAAIRIGHDGWPARRLENILALGQHYGVPTRLLDWTKSAAVAAHFAAADAMRMRGEKRGAAKAVIWAFKIAELQGTSKFAQRVRDVRATKAINPNQHAQGGLFTLIPSHNDGPPPPLCEVAVSEGAGGLLEKNMLPTSEVMRLHEIVATVAHVTARSVAPGYVGVVDSLKEAQLRRRLLEQNGPANSIA